jgi:hypothetical protein
MAIDPSIALGVRPLQIENPLSMYSTVAGIQNAQNQNALAQYTLAAARRGEETENALNKAYMEAYNPQTGQIDLPTLRAKVATAGVGSKLPAIEKQLAEVEKEQLARKEQLGKVVNQKFEQSKGLLANVQTPEQYIAWHEANHSDPVLGEYLKSRGVTAESSRAQIMAELAKPGGLQNLIERSSVALDKMPTILQQQAERAALSGRAPVQPMAAPVSNALVPTAQQAQPVANAMVAPVQTAAVPPPVVTAMPATSALQGELSAVNNEISRLVGSDAAGLPGVQARIKALEEQKARLFTAITQERNAATSEEQARISGRQAQLAADRLAFEQSTAADFRSSPAGVVRIDKITGETRIVKDANGKPVMDVAAAQAAEAARHARVIESQGAARIGQENQRIALQRQADARAEYQAKQPKFDASAGGFVYSPSAENPQGKFVAVTGIEGKPPNEAQGNAIAYGVRMEGSNKILESLEGKGVTSGGRIKGFVSGTLEALVPYQGEKLAAGAESVLRPFLSSEGQNNYEQAKENFITAVLRKESGASISPAEFAREERKYFPQVGDDASTIKQKQEARRLAISAIRQVAGPFAKNIDAISSGAAGGPSTGAATGADPLGLRK